MADGLSQNEELKPEPRLDPNLPEYPTPEQAETMYNAWRTGGQEGIRQALREARLMREKATGSSLSEDKP